MRGDDNKKTRIIGNEVSFFSNFIFLPFLRLHRDIVDHRDNISRLPAKSHSRSILFPILKNLAVGKGEYAQTRVFVFRVLHCASRARVSRLAFLSAHSSRLSLLLMCH